MTRNITRLIVAGILVIAFLLYLAWERNQVRYGRKPQSPHCTSNLKQIAIAFRLWSGNHNGQYPWNVSTNEGGTRELTIVDNNGFAVNPTVHFLALFSDLQTPKLLVCPKDSTKKVAVTFTNLSIENITYRLHILTNTSAINSKKVLLVCPIDDNTLYYDGTVKGEPVENEDGRHPMEVATNFQFSPKAAEDGNAQHPTNVP